MDFLRSRAVPALAALAALAFTPAAHADCSAVNGTYADESLEKVDGSPRTLSSFATSKERPRLVHTERTGPAPTFGGGGGQVMSRPKVTRLVQTVKVSYGAELHLRYLDAAGKPLAETNSITPRRWQCVAGRLERKYRTASGLGDVIRTEETEQVLMAAPGGDLTLVETTTVVEGPKAPPKRSEVRFKRVS